VDHRVLPERHLLWLDLQDYRDFLGHLDPLALRATLAIKDLLVLQVLVLQVLRGHLDRQDLVYKDPQVPRDPRE
jgi:hypothetical protein